MRQDRFKFLSIVNAVVILTGLSLMAGLSWQLASRVDDLQATPSENVQWSLSRLEVEYLNLRLASEAVLTLGAPALPEFRKRYDIFYSRVSSIDESAGAVALHATPELHHQHENLKEFLNETVDLVDAPDETLVNGMSMFLARLDVAATATRALSMGGIAISAKIADAKRVKVSRLLYLIAVAAPVTFIALFVAIARQKSQKKELNRRSQKLAAANRRYTSTLRASLDAIVVVNENGLITDFNGSAEQVFGHSRELVIYKPFVETLTPHQFRQTHSANFANYVSGKISDIVDVGRLELIALHSDGHEFPIEISVSKTVGETGGNFVAYIRDITQQRESQQELQKARDDALEAFQEKSKFFAMMSHEMRTPLNGIMSSLDLLKDGRLDAAQKRYVNIAETSSRILLSHVDDVLMIERLDAGDRAVTPETFKVREVVSSLIDTLRPLASERNNEIISVHEGAEQTVVGDMRGLQQILTNLTSNAIKFTSSGLVTVRTATSLKDDGTVLLRIAVADTGTGISEENKSRIFDDFVTVESPYERTATGTGLGLGIVRRLVQGMGGTLVCESNPDQGSTFHLETIWQRAKACDVAPATKAGPTDLNLITPLNILLVEDNEINRELLAAMIERDGHNVASASNGFEGVHKAGEQHFDLILMDISMPNMNGVVATQTIRASKSLNAHTPIYAVTAHAMPKEIEKFELAGMDGCLVKPIQFGKLRDLMAAVAEKMKGPEASDKPLSAGVGPDHILLDFEQMEELISVLGRKKASNLFASFCADSRTSLSEIRACVETQDTDQLQKLAHKLSGSCGTFGAVRLKETLHQIETACKQGSPGRAMKAAKNLDQIWRDTYEGYGDMYDKPVS